MSHIDTLVRLHHRQQSLNVRIEGVKRMTPGSAAFAEIDSIKEAQLVLIDDFHALSAAQADEREERDADNKLYDRRQRWILCVLLNAMWVIPAIAWGLHL